MSEPQSLLVTANMLAKTRVRCPKGHEYSRMDNWSLVVFTDADSKPIAVVKDTCMGCLGEMLNALPRATPISDSA